MAQRNSTIAKAILKMIEKKLQEKVDSCNPINDWIEPHLKKEKDKYSTYLRQVRDILQLFEK
jgi:hypothetical protein